MALGLGTIYKLGQGGFHPENTRPGDAENECDCSGFVCWCLGMSRLSDIPFYKKTYGGYIYTNSIYADAQASTGIFTQIDSPKPGALIVYPGGDIHKYGHVGIITSVEDGKVSKVIHCSSSNYHNDKDAIQETERPKAFDALKTIFAWYDGLVE